ncbi:conserved exported hypothetical protein [Pseudomonas sp. 8Z]|uniref:lysozyme inhibitor LprI family protein n=1 Tax=Pseudomonas sp. 8Z TaxID=2653166 RepID=UPI0012F0D32C|nr:lysozyme inhibitor LprI family protein [Pseudomonas sp. 8Z]VXC98352.1 conserved exported hypothetical protein [Pseudomonas sp. 8Z]
MAHRFLIPLACLLPMFAEAASFDCAKASHPIEHAICADAQLSALDERLASTFRRIRQFSASGDSSLLEEQRAWLRDTRQQCAAGDVAGCVRQRYEWRLQELSEQPSEAKAFETQDFLHLDNASTTYDFRLALDEPCDEQYCESSGKLAILAKGSSKPLQVITLPGIYIARDERGQPLVNSARLYDYQGVINVDDFNFDGHEDFAVQNGNHGSYGGPSYDVFLYDSKQQAFRHSQAMTRLIASTLGFFDVDAQAQRLQTLAKSGCCWHRTSRYRVEGNTPVEVWRSTDGASLHMSGYVREVEELRNGKWHLLKRVQLKDYE